MADLDTKAPACLAPISSDDAANMDIGVLGQQPGMQIYTQITYCYAVPDGNSRRRAHIVSTLQNGLARLAAAFPWLAGRVAYVEDDAAAAAAAAEGSGRYRFRPLAATPRLVVKDLATVAPALTMDALRQADFPFRLLDEAVVAPRRTLPGNPDEAHLASTDTPVLLVQAGFVPGGLLLTFAAHHATMDMAGEGEVIRWLHKACRGEPFTDEELAAGNCDRRHVVPLLAADDGDPAQYIPEQLVPVVSNHDASPSDTPTENWEVRAPAPCSWVYFAFSRTSLDAIKVAATATLPPTASFVSTNDALTAFLWQAVLRARRPRLVAHNNATTTVSSTLARAVDVRACLGIPASYPALVQTMTIHTTTVDDVCTAPLGDLAARLRAALAPAHLRQRTRALATFLDRGPHAQRDVRLSFVGPVDPAAGGLMLSSWTAVPGYALDFGLGLGPAEAVRRPAFVPAVESLGYLMPTAADGSVAAGLCLRDADVARMRADETFTALARFVG
ncbi:Chloramphenicol acetyltransferase-like domain protein [Niveomyces insectorum RCEF 264]|uniref:Chloramphenicol acetyltransferase-like domain protein n=1 Tax=Niveomyces insectorum RCEF 264 TaxID=1081102 RepID=A0A167XA26_9HYPO|nr:Chloramphenicol acetyltransferase-like domain protein [Niveomyces insectorum RCEF 264]